MRSALSRRRGGIGKLVRNKKSMDTAFFDVDFKRMSFTHIRATLLKNRLPIRGTAGPGGNTTAMLEAALLRMDG
jgi:hypothetical protein